MGKACAHYGGFGDCTAFTNKGPKHELFGSLLRNTGYSSTGNELLYSGESGEQLEMEFFTYDGTPIPIERTLGFNNQINNKATLLSSSIINSNIIK